MDELTTQTAKKKRGRPVGYRLSEESKRAISESKKGQRHNIETREKISRSLKRHFRNLNPLSSEVRRAYGRCGKDTCEWVKSTPVKEALDLCDDVLTDRCIRNTNKVEIAFGEHIERFSHEFTPEAMLLFKEECRIIINKIVSGGE